MNQNGLTKLSRNSDYQIISTNSDVKTECQFHVCLNVSGSKGCTSGGNLYGFIIRMNGRNFQAISRRIVEDHMKLWRSTDRQTLSGEATIK